MEKMLVTQALDERDLLAKRIGGSIDSATFVDLAKKNSDKVISAKIDKEEFKKNAVAQFQSISDLIARYNRLDKAISKSNSTTEIEVCGEKMTVANAISFKMRMQKHTFEVDLWSKLRIDWERAKMTASKLNNDLNDAAESMRLSILGKDTKVKEEKPLAVVEEYVKENTAELCDPLDAEKKTRELQDNLDAFLKAIDTQIKVSNATTTIEF